MVQLIKKYRKQQTSIILPTLPVMIKCCNRETGLPAGKLETWHRIASLLESDTTFYNVALSGRFIFA